MSAAITLDVSDIAGLQAFMAEIADVPDAKRTELMDNIGNVGIDSVEESFIHSKSPDGEPWLPSFRVRTFGGKTLVKSSAGLATTIEANASADEVEVGSNRVYARIHQMGGVIRGNPLLKFNIPGLGFRSVESVTMPARPFLGWGRDALDEVKHQAEDWLASLLPPGSLAGALS